MSDKNTWLLHDQYPARWLCSSYCLYVWKLQVYITSQHYWTTSCRYQ